jgi:2-methylcitrate dehydratase PrpD
MRPDRSAIQARRLTPPARAVNFANAGEWTDERHRSSPRSRSALFERVPAARARDRARAILDGLACAVAGRDERVTRELRGFALEQGSHPRATLWGSGERVSPALAALVNGAAAHALDFDDVSWAMNGHPTVPLLPAAFASAEALGCSGEDLLRAYVVGFEVEARLGQALGKPHYERGWHATSTLGVFGATAASAVLLGLDEAGLRRAFGIALSRAAGTRANFGTDTKPLHAGLAARAGLEAAELALRGVGAREDAFEMSMGLADLYGGATPFALPPLDAGLDLERPGVELNRTRRAASRTATTPLAAEHARPRAARDRVRAIRSSEDPHLPGARTGSGSGSRSNTVSRSPGSTDGRVSARSRTLAPGLTQAALLRAGGRARISSAEEEVELVFATARARESVRVARGNPQNPLSDAAARGEGDAVPGAGARRRARARSSTDRLAQKTRDVRELARSLA